jgi:hypothetical protein
MRQFLVAAALALGLIALWAAILPLTAQPAPPHASAAPPGMSKALFLCRGQHGIDRACAAALAKALVLDEPEPATKPANDGVCRMDHPSIASAEQHD